MQNDADKWRKRGEALRKAIEETAEVTANDSRERQEVIDKIRKALTEDRFPITDEEGTKREATEGEKFWSRFALEIIEPYLTFQQRQIALGNQLVEFLEKFGNELYGFFLQGFYSDSPMLDPSTVYPPGYVLRTLLNQISIDLNIAQVAVHQRRYPDPPRSPFGTLQAWSLTLADGLGEHAIQPARDNGFLQQYTPVVTYFEKNLSTRLVPYYDVLLIGIPYSTLAEQAVISDKMGLSPDLLAIPHEVGHYLFWKGRVPGSELTVQTYLWNRLKKASIRPWDWRWQWLEELFADAYSCLIAGPVAVLNFQDLLTDNLPEHFRQDPAKHPIPILRPFIQSRILRKIKTADGNALYKMAPGLLDDEWKSSIEKRLYGDEDEPLPLEAKYQIQGVPQLIKGKEIVNAVDEVIDLILEALPVPRPADANPSWTPWTSDLPENASDVSALYQDFLDKFFYPEEEWVDYKVVSSESALQPFREKLSDIAANARDKPILESEWKELFLVRGWSTEGPESNGFR